MEKDAAGQIKSIHRTVHDDGVRRFRDFSEVSIVMGDMRLWRLGWHWNQLGQRDPLASILTRAADEDANWDVDEFFETGRLEVSRLMERVERLVPALPKRRALDFGCGVGRVTQALAGYFDETIGVDVAHSMIRRARSWNRLPDRCRFALNRRAHLKRFETNGFDLVYSRLVLQHIPPRLARRYVPELLRVLSPGGILVFQLPVPEDDPENEVHVDSLQAFCEAPVVGGRFKRSLPPSVVRTYRRLKYPLLPLVISRFWRDVFRRAKLLIVPHMEMFGLPRETVVTLVERAGGRVVEMRPDSSAGNVPSFEYWVTKRPSEHESPTGAG